MPYKKIRVCHTCSHKAKRLVEVTWFQGLIHRLRRHFVFTLREFVPEGEVRR